MGIELALFWLGLASVIVFFVTRPLASVRQELARNGRMLNELHDVLEADGWSDGPEPQALPLSRPLPWTFEALDAYSAAEIKARWDQAIDVWNARGESGWSVEKGILASEPMQRALEEAYYRALRRENVALARQLKAIKRFEQAGALSEVQNAPEGAVSLEALDGAGAVRLRSKKKVTQ